MQMREKQKVRRLLRRVGEGSSATTTRSRRSAEGRHRREPAATARSGGWTTWCIAWASAATRAESPSAGVRTRPSLVNGKPVNVPSYQVASGRPRWWHRATAPASQLQHPVQALELAEPARCRWSGSTPNLTWTRCHDRGHLSAGSGPQRAARQEINENLIVELYSK